MQDLYATKLLKYLTIYDTDIYVITETWLAERDPVVIGEITSEGYSFFNFCRKVDEHGGIGIIYKSNLIIQNTPIDIETHLSTHLL